MKNIRYQWFDNHIYKDSPGLQSPTPTEKPICGADVPSKTTMRGYILACDVAGESKACKKCSKIVDKHLNEKV
jgi:hypothetical protein